VVDQLAEDEGGGIHMALGMDDNGSHEKFASSRVTWHENGEVVGNPFGDQSEMGVSGNIPAVAVSAQPLSANVPIPCGARWL
jgi:hypothetical protein